MGRWLLALALVFGVAAGIVLGALNPDAVTLNLAFAEWRAPLGAVVAVALGLGLVTGLLAGIALMLLRRRRAGRRGAAGDSDPSGGTDIADG